MSDFDRDNYIGVYETVLYSSVEIQVTANVVVRGGSTEWVVFSVSLKESDTTRHFTDLQSALDWAKEKAPQ